MNYLLIEPKLNISINNDCFIERLFYLNMENNVAIIIFSKLSPFSVIKKAFANYLRHYNCPNLIIYTY